MKLTRALFPVDFSPRCVDAIPLVKSWIAHFRSELTLLHVVGVPATLRFASSDRLHSQLREELLQESNIAMTDFVDRYFKPVALQYTIAEGDPTQIIVDRARKDHTDLVMMPTHGYGPFIAMRNRCAAGNP